MSDDCGGVLIRSVALLISRKVSSRKNLIEMVPPGVAEGFSGPNHASGVPQLVATTHVVIDYNCFVLFRRLFSICFNIEINVNVV